MYGSDGIQRLPRREGCGFMAPHLQVVAANMWHGSLSAPGSICFVVHPKVKEKCKQAMDFLTQETQPVARVHNFAGTDRVLRYNTLVQRSFQSCFLGQ